MVLAVALLLGGAIVGAATVLTHARTFGLVIGFVASLASCLALPPGWHGRLAFVVGWDLVLGYVLLPRAAGGYLVSDGVHGYVLLAMGLLLLLIAIVTLVPPGKGCPVDS